MRLADAMGTRYLTEGNVDRLTDLLIESKATMDLAGCKITQGIAEIIEKNPLRFIDSKDENRNFILVANREAAENREKLGKIDTLPRMGDTGISDYLRGLDISKCYDILSDADMPITAFVYAMCPNIMIAIGAYTGQFGEYIMRKLYGGDTEKFIRFVRDSHEFYLYDRSMVTEVSVTIEDQEVCLSTGERYPLREIFINKTLIPKKIGHERINHLPLYAEFIQNVYKDASMKPVQELSLYDILTEEVRND